MHETLIIADASPLIALVDTAAKRLGLTVTGTVGVLLKAKEQGLITSGQDILEKLEKHGFWLSEELRTLISGK